MGPQGFSWTGIFGRFAAALVLVYGTFNPEGYSFFHWAINPMVRGQMEVAGQQLPVKLLAALLLVAVWIFFLKATRRSIGWMGALLMVGILGALVWALIDWHVLNPTSSRAIAHVVLVALALVLTIGMSWSHVTRKVTGQVDTDEA